jgi:hypothetical protein
MLWVWGVFEAAGMLFEDALGFNRFFLKRTGKYLSAAIRYSW